MGSHISIDNKAFAGLVRAVNGQMVTVTDGQKWVMFSNGQNNMIFKLKIQTPSRVARTRGVSSGQGGAGGVLKPGDGLCGRAEHFFRNGLF